MIRNTYTKLLENIDQSIIVTLNPYIVEGSHLIEKWFEGCKAAKATSVQHTTLAYHGTFSDTNLDSICANGFDPSRRARQAHGPGEYFTEDIDYAMSFSGATKVVVGTLIIKGKWTVQMTVKTLSSKNPEVNILVVQNPKETIQTVVPAKYQTDCNVETKPKQARKITFCLPVLLLWRRDVLARCTAQNSLHSFYKLSSKRLEEVEMEVQSLNLNTK